MDHEKLKNLIESCLEKGIEPLKGALARLSESQKSTIDYHSNLDKSTLQALIDYLKIDPSVVLTFDEKLLNAGSHATRVTLESLAKWLVIKSQEIGVKDTIDQLNKYLILDKTPAYAILAISGIEPKEEIRLSNNITLIPFDHLPPSSPKEALYPPFLNNDFLIGQGFMPFSLYGGYRPPKAALVKRCGVFPKAYDAKESVTSSVENFSDLYEACEFLTLFSNSTPVPVGAWSEVDSGVPCKEMLGAGWGYPTVEVLSSLDVSFDASDWKDLKPVYDSFSRMKQESRDLLRIPIQRINQARRRKNNADKAIDQGVAAEALFLNDKLHNEQLSFTLRLRAALLLGETFEKRQELIDFFSAFYACRSQAAHSGKLDTKIKIPRQRKIDASDLLKKSDELCIKAIIKIIENGKFPDWNRLMLAVGVEAKNLSTR